MNFSIDKCSAYSIVLSWEIRGFLPDQKAVYYHKTGRLSKKRAIPAGSRRNLPARAFWVPGTRGRQGGLKAASRLFRKTFCFTDKLVVTERSALKEFRRFAAALPVPMPFPQIPSLRVPEHPEAPYK